MVPGDRPASAATCRRSIGAKYDRIAEAGRAGRVSQARAVDPPRPLTSTARRPP
jgi:hypothetical protein